MSNNIIQPSFSAGELSPTLYARVDYAKYHVGLAKCRNFFVDYRGGASTRSGTEFVALTKGSEYGNDPTKPVRLIPFQFSTIQSYELEFGDMYMRVIIDGAPALESSKIISSISNTNPGTITSIAHGFLSGQTVFLSVPTGMTELNDITAITAFTTLNTFQLIDIYTGAAIDTTTFGTYVSGGTVSRVYTLTPSPYAAEDLALLKFTQSADVMTLTHPNYAPRELSRITNTHWEFSIITFASSIAAPTSPTATPDPATVGTAAYAYVVTAVGADGQESIASARADATLAIDIASVPGSVAISWTAAPGASYYNIYKASEVTDGSIPLGVNFGFMADSTTTDSVDANIVPDFTSGPPTHQDPFAGNNWPGTVAYFSQRLVFAATTLQPETFWMTKPGAFANMDVANPIQPDDAITGTLVSQQVNAIKYMIAMPGGLIMLTSGGAWQVSGGSANAPVTPTTITATPQAYNGCADVQPLVINYDILYVQAKGAVVRDLAYNFYTNIYTGTDVSILSNHFFSGYTIKEWAYAEEPFKVIWAVRSDGNLLSLTYLKEQEIQGWAYHNTFGFFKSVSTIQEGTENAVYFVVKRKIGTRGYLQYIERMHNRNFPYGVEDAWAVDCGLTNVLVYPSGDLTASAITGSNVAFISTSAIFTSGDIGKVLRMGGGIATITAYVSPEQLTGTFTRDVQQTVSDGLTNFPAPAAAGEWSLTMPFTTFEGLSHLEGATVSVVGDGNVFPLKTVVNGSITLEHPCSKVTVGLAFLPQMQTLYLDVGEPTIQGKRKRIAALSTRVTETRGLSYGNTFDTLVEFKQRDDQPMGQPIELETGDQRIVMDPLWNQYGQICIQQNYPLPATVLGVIPEIIVGDTK